MAFDLEKMHHQVTKDTKSTKGNRLG